MTCGIKSRATKPIYHSVVQIVWDHIVNIESETGDISMSALGHIKVWYVRQGIGHDMWCEW